MSSSFEDDILNFDTSLLQECPSETEAGSRADQQDNSILLLKTKILSTNFAIMQILTSRQQSQDALNECAKSTEEVKRIRIEYNNVLDEAKKLRKNDEFQRRHIKELTEKLEVSDVQCKAVQSHANQLQQLVQEYERKIESLKIENKPAKAKVKVNKKEQISKESNSLNSEIGIYLHDLCLFRDIIVGKKNLQSHHKRILKKYEKIKSNTYADDYPSDCSINDIEDIFNDSTSSALSTDLLQKTRTLQGCQSFTARDSGKNKHYDDLQNKIRDADHDSDSCTEVISEDTGRGSSLASSDIEKCFNSPDYFLINSPFNNGMVKDKKHYTDMSTSPITVQIERSNACTSPLSFSNEINDINICDIHKQTKDIGIQVHSNDLISYSNTMTSPVKIRVRERATSPLRIIQLDQALSPIKMNTMEDVTSPVQNTSRTSKKLQERTMSLSKHIQLERSADSDGHDEINSSAQISAQEKESLEINNMEVYDDNKDIDCEVENILRSVRLDYNLITPIPRSPAKGQKHDNIPPHEYCPHAGLVSEELYRLMAEFYALKRDIYGQKSITPNGKVHDATNNCNDNDIITINHEIDLTKPIENFETFESPVQNSAIELNVVNSTKPPDIEVSFEIDKVQNENQINSNKSEDRIITQQYTITNQSPIQVMDKVKKTKKLTRLEKLRKKLLPKGKIRRSLTPPIRKISRRNPLLFKKRIMEHSTTPAQCNKIAYENAVKVMAEIRAKEKNKSINITPCKDTVKNIITQEVQIVLSKCDVPLAQNKNIVNTAHTGRTPLSIESSEKPNTCNSVSNIENNSTETHVNKPPTNVDNSPSQLILRRSKRLSSTSSNSSDKCNKTVVKTAGGLPTNETQPCKRLKTIELEKLNVPHKKLLQTSKPSPYSNLDSIHNVSADTLPSNTISKPVERRRRSARLSSMEKDKSQIKEDLPNLNTAKVVIYNDLDMFSEQTTQPQPQSQTCQKNSSEDASYFKDSLLCKLIKKHGRSSVKWNAKKLPEIVINAMCEKIEGFVAELGSLSQANAVKAMDNFKQDLRKCNVRIFLGGLMNYLADTGRANEMKFKNTHLHSPPMTKSERSLLYVLKELRYFWCDHDLIGLVLRNVQYTLFKLNHAPDFGTVESLSHFYALLCKYLGRLDSLRMFVLDAMYCLQFKCIAVIKQCIEVWMHIIPLAHLGMAKSPLVICLVYLLHFYKCEDKYNRVQEMRMILHSKYCYNIYEWSESNILEMLKSTITELSDNVIERKMLRMCLIIFAKRKGPQWCQKHIINTMLLPLIRKDDVPDNVKGFCISMLGPLLKPYPSIMKFQCESVFNELLVMLEKAATPMMKEAILSSLLCMRYNPERVHLILFKWRPDSLSAEFEKILVDYVKEKPAHVWKKEIEKIASNTNKYKTM